MLITKIFHLRQPIHEARRRLREMGASSSAEGDAEVSCSMNEAEGIGRFEFSAHGHSVAAEIQELPGKDPNRILFHSVRGDIELAGIVELYPIRENLTEISLTLDYEPVSPLQKVFGTLDRFLNRQLARVEGCMERARSAGGVAQLGKFA